MFCLITLLMSSCMAMCYVNRLDKSGVSEFSLLSYGLVSAKDSTVVVCFMYNVQ